MNTAKRIAAALIAPVIAASILAGGIVWGIFAMCWASYKYTTERWIK